MLRPREENLTLIRYNGASHCHGNIAYRPHIHYATEKAIVAGIRADRHAKETDRYWNLDGAIGCMIEDCNIQDVPVQRYRKRYQLNLYDT